MSHHALVEDWGGADTRVDAEPHEACGDTLVDAEQVDASESHERTAGQRIARYIVIRKLGAGAMGVVYAAYDPKLDRKVAIKLLATVEEADRARQRLHREAQALAKLAHPHVVGVYDVDVHEGQLYVAMEFVAGRTLSTWLSEAARPWPEVLATFVQAGRGLAAAHGAGLIHRDFKPDNVMIGDDERVRVMDFGLARPEDTLASIEDLRASFTAQLGLRPLEVDMTRTGTLMGTPAYMALEQFEGQADARSDQFGFCVALYEALYGERPFAADSLAELLAVLADGKVEPAPRGAVVPAWLRAVIVRGLASDPARRWPSMDALLDALLDDPAIRRRRFAGAALVAGLLAGLGGAALWSAEHQAHACTGFEAKLVGIWDEREKARVESAFAATGLVYADDSYRGAARRLDDYAGQWVAAREDACEASQRGEQSGALLDLRMACLDERLQHVAATVELLESADAGVVRQAVDAVAGLPSLERCADVEALTAEQPPPDEPVVAARVAELDAQLIEAETLERAGAYEPAMALVDAVVAQADELDHAPLHVRASLIQGRMQMRLGAYIDAEATLEHAYASALGSKMLPEAAEAGTRLVDVVGSRMARFEDARRWAVHVEPLVRATATPEVEANLLNNMANVARAQGDFAEARTYLERALAIREKSDGPNHDVAATLVSLGILAHQQGNYGEAHAYHQRALAIDTKVLGPDHPNVATALNYLGSVAHTEGKFEDARSYFERALAIRERALGPDHPDVASTLTSLASVARDEGNYEEARGFLERALSIEDEMLGPDHPRVAITLTVLGGVASSERDYDEARPHYERALAIFEKALGSYHPNVAVSLNNLGVVARGEGKYDEARAYGGRALILFEKALGPDHPKVAFALTTMGEVAQDEGKHTDARAYHERASTILETVTPDHPDLAYPLTGLGRALLGLGRPADAIAPLDRALTLRNAHEGDPALLGETRFALAQALWTAPADAGRNRGRARELAELAAEAYAAAGSQSADELDEVGAWQAARAG